MSANRMREGIRLMRESGAEGFEGFDPDNLPPFMVEDDQLDAVIESPEHTDAKLAAMRAHASQITPDGMFFAMGVDLAKLAWGTEHYRLVRGTRGPVGESGLEEDLFAGL